MSNDSRVLDGKIALVTGGSRGLGREMVRAFARAGADVVIASRKLEACEALAVEVRADTGREAFPVQCHVGNWSEIERLADTVYDHFGCIDVLVNNAGMSPLFGTLLDVSEQLWDKVLDVNLKGPFRLTSIVGTRMVEQGSGSIIMLSSGGSLRPYGGIIPYASAKAGINAMTVGFAQAFGPTVRVNCILPGMMLSDVSKAWDMDAASEAQQRTTALRRFGRPDEIVGAALYFASDASSFTTGALLSVDGGLR